ncbi:MAG: hypothetical protein V3V05_08755 [Pontiella sp.]
MTNKANMCILFRDETVEVAFVDRTVLGTQIKFMERLPRDEKVFGEVAALMQSAEKPPGRVLLCIPRELVMQRTLRYPAMAPPDVTNMIQFEASRHVPLPENERALAWAFLPSPDEKQVVINLLAGRDAEVRDLINRFKDAGVPVDEAVPFSSALFPLLADKPTLLVISDALNVELCLYGEGQLQDSQLLNRNMSDFSPGRIVTTARQMTAKHKDWLGMEGLSRIFACGTEPLGFDLDAAFNLQVQPLEVPVDFSAVEYPLTDVLLAVTAELPAELNLIETSGRKVPLSKRTILVASLCALLAIELLVSMGFKTGAPALQRKAVAEEISKVRRRAAPIQRMKDKNREMRKQLYRLDEICSQHVSGMEIWRELSETLPADSYLQLAYFKSGDSLNIRGLSKEPDRLPEIFLASQMIEAISKSDIGKKEGEYQSFSITVTLRTSDEETGRL